MENVVPVRSMLKQWSHNDKPSLGPDSDAREYTATGAVVCEGRLQRQIGSIGRSPRHCELRDDPALLLFSASLPRKLLSEIFLEPRVTVIDCDEAGTLTLSRLPKERNRDQAGTVRLVADNPEMARQWQLDIHTALGYQADTLRPPTAADASGASPQVAREATRARAQSSIDRGSAKFVPPSLPGVMEEPVAVSHHRSRAASSLPSSPMQIGQLLHAELGVDPAASSSYATRPAAESVVRPDMSHYTSYSTDASGRESFSGSERGGSEREDIAEPPSTSALGPFVPTPLPAVTEEALAVRHHRTRAASSLQIGQLLTAELGADPAAEAEASAPVARKRTMTDLGAFTAEGALRVRSQQQ